MRGEKWSQSFERICYNHGQRGVVQELVDDVPEAQRVMPELPDTKQRVHDRLESVIFVESQPSSKLFSSFDRPPPAWGANRHLWKNRG
jgi:hypothetical protein